LAELILTDEEKAAVNWIDLDDASIGKVVKSIAFKLEAHPRAHSSVITGAAPDDDAISWAGVCMLLIGSCVERNADKFSSEIHGMTHKDEKWGDWKVTVERLKK
jgi:hypothetical protein